MKEVKLIIVILMFTMLSVSCSNTIEEEKRFPDEIYDVIAEYVGNINDYSEISIRNEYLIILAFIDESITAFHENLRRSFAKDIFSVKRPVLVDGELSIIEKEVDTSFMWDNHLDQYKQTPNIDPIGEALNIISYTSMYNYFLQHWYSRYGVMLSNFKNIDSEIDNFQNIIKNHPSYIDIKLE